jgi:PRTRC genetic system ThiF family protein
VKRKPVAIDTTALRALPVRLAEYRQLRIIQVGCGGTGSHLARTTAAVAAALRDRGESVELVFCDPDIVEAKNVPRQLFAASDIGRPKAGVLAERYSASWSLAAGVDATPFSAAGYELWNSYDRRLTVIVGAVDNAAARREMAKACEANREGALPSVWWIDAGNAADSGQVIVGSDANVRNLRGSVQLGAVWRLPTPSLVAPDLLVSRAEELAQSRMSCAELVAANLQSQTVNAWAATLAGDTLYRLLVSRDLARFATWFDARSAIVRSTSTSPGEIARAAGVRESSLSARKPRRKAA